MAHEAEHHEEEVDEIEVERKRHASEPARVVGRQPREPGNADDEMTN
jgi:hypothetical protein